jgi:hypothetical protein
MAAAEFIPPLPEFDSEKYIVDKWYFFYLAKQQLRIRGVLTRSCASPGCFTSAVSYCIYYKLISESKLTQRVMTFDLPTKSHLTMLPFTDTVKIDASWIDEINEQSKRANRDLYYILNNYLFITNPLHEFVHDPGYIMNGQQLFMMAFVNMDNPENGGTLFYISHYFVILRISSEEFVIISSYGSNNVKIPITVKKFSYENWATFVRTFTAETPDERSGIGEFFKTYFLDRSVALMPTADRGTPLPTSIEGGIENEIEVYVTQKHNIICVPHILDVLDTSVPKPELPPPRQSRSFSEPPKSRRSQRIQSILNRQGAAGGKITKKRRNIRKYKHNVYGKSNKKA